MQAPKSLLPMAECELHDVAGAGMSTVVVLFSLHHSITDWSEEVPLEGVAAASEEHTLEKITCLALGASAELAPA